MHDLLFSGPDLSKELLAAHGRKLGLDIPRYGECLAKDATKAIQEDIALARSMGVTGTPGFVFGTMQEDGRVSPSVVVTGAQPFSSFERVLDSLIDGTAAKK